nr:MAG TPA: hypothetical protein [Caudoviricetes sp.]
MRIPVITRTITTTRVELICLNVESGKTESVFMTFTREPKDDYILNKAKLVYENDNYKVVYIANKVVSTDKYSMYESEFVEKAKKIKE